jgi:elongation factor 1-gamma
MALTLHTEPGNFRAFKILIAADYNGINLNVPAFTLGESNKTAEYLKISPLGKVPALQTATGSLTESNAIARYVARMRADTGLFGATFFESAEVDQWVDFCSHNIELPVCMWVYPVMGFMAANAANAAKAKADLAAALTVVEKHLALRTYLVGNAITLADITIASTLVYPFKFVCDAAFRAQFPNTMRWFNTCVNQTSFSNILGTVTLATKEAAAGTGSALPAPPKAGKKAWDGVPKEKVKKEKKEKAPAPPKAPKEAKKEVEPEEEPPAPKEKKEDHIFKKMDGEKPSPFVMDAWKRNYSNCNGDYDAAMKYFWENLDAEGWSLYRGEYNYNDELKVLFMTSNLVGGFIQRTDEIRKWLFGTMIITGDDVAKDMKISAYFFIRGQDIQPLIDCNDDAACYTWTKMALPASEGDKETLKNFWKADVDDVIENRKVLDSRVYK